jgi:hypothetical protein
VKKKNDWKGIPVPVSDEYSNTPEPQASIFLVALFIYLIISPLWFLNWFGVLWVDHTLKVQGFYVISNIFLLWATSFTQANKNTRILAFCCLTSGVIWTLNMIN